jgi:hypothetical protein
MAWASIVTRQSKNSVASFDGRYGGIGRACNRVALNDLNSLQLVVRVRCGKCPLGSDQIHLSGGKGGRHIQD